MQMFGGITAVGNFDILGNTAVSLTCAICECKKEFVHRHLDDVPFVSTAESGLCEKFSKTYKEVCEVINLKLADNCDRNEKAFTNVTYGKVLGIWFNSENPPIRKEGKNFKMYLYGYECCFCYTPGNAEIDGKFE